MKLNNYIKTVTFSMMAGAGLIALSSCDDMLDKAPAGQFTADQITDESVEALMASAYAGLEAHFFGNNEAFSGPSTNWIFDVRSDDALKGGGATSMEQNIHQLEISNLTSDNSSNLYKWENNYFAIARVHKAMDAVTGSSLSETSKTIYLGELKLLRAYFYFDLYRLYQRFPYITENDIPTEVRYDNKTRAEIYAAIKQDILDAWNVLPDHQSAVGRNNKYVAAALMAKVAAFGAEWSVVEEYANYVIDSKKYDLYNNFLDMSKVAFNNTKESILAIQCSTDNDNMHINWSNLLNTTYSEGNHFGNGDDFFLGSQNLVNAFRTDENGLPYLDSFNEVNVTSGGTYAGSVDPRLDFTVGRIGFPFRGYTYNENWCRAKDIYGEYSGKKGMVDPDGSDMVSGFPWGGSALNFCLIRYADILLLEAEALIEQSKDLTRACNLVNSVREKAARSVDAGYTPVDVNPMLADYNVADYTVASFQNQDYARKAVRMERRLELAMEGNRWFDLVRWGEYDKARTGNNSLITTMNEYMTSEAASHSYYEGASVTEDEIYLAIPLTEVQNSNGLYE